MILLENLKRTLKKSDLSDFLELNIQTVNSVEIRVDLKNYIKQIVDFAGLQDEHEILHWLTDLK